LSREFKKPNYSTRGGPGDDRSLNSSFDYIDLNMNDALKAVEVISKSGRGRAFYKK